MDDRTADGAPATDLRDGFPGQRMRALPRPLVARASTGPVTGQILVTDVGYFPRASAHRRRRPGGAPQTIVIVCSAGRGWCEIGGTRHAVVAGQALVVPAGTPHTYQADDDDPWTIWWFHVTGRAVPDLVAATGTTVAEPVLGVAEPSRVLALVDTMIRRMERDETTSSLIAASGAAWHALALLAADRRSTTGRREDPVAATLEHLRANVGLPVSVPDLAAMAGLSRSHYAVLFRRATGYSVVEYQTRLRMGRARELLDTTDLTVAAVARHAGYDDPLYFARQFRRIHSMSPTQYRAREHG